MNDGDKYLQNRLADFQNAHADAESQPDGITPSGDVLETFFRDFLAGFLPLKFGVTAGRIIGKDGSLSAASDAIVYDALNSPVIRVDDDGPARQLVPAESVISVIEVAPVLTVESFGGVIGALRSLRETPGLKNDAFGAFIAFSPPELGSEEEIISYINRVNNLVVESGIHTFLRFGCALPNLRHGAVASSTGSVPCFEYLKHRQSHDETVPHKTVKDLEQYGNFALTYPETVLHIFMINLVENLNKWTCRKYGVLDYFAAL